MTGFQSKRAVTDRETNEHVHVLDSDLKIVLTDYIADAEKGGADGSVTVAEVISVLIAIACQLSSIVMTKEGMLEVASFAYDKHMEDLKSKAH